MGTTQARTHTHTGTAGQMHPWKETAQEKKNELEILEGVRDVSPGLTCHVTVICVNLSHGRGRNEEEEEEKSLQNDQIVHFLTGLRSNKSTERGQHLEQSGRRGMTFYRRVCR